MGLTEQRIKALEMEVDLLRQETVALRERIARTYDLIRTEDVTVLADKDFKEAGDGVGLWDRYVNKRCDPTGDLHFRTSGIPSGWAWAGAPFSGTPAAGVNYAHLGTYLKVNQTSGNRYFFYDSVSNPTSSTSISARIGMSHAHAIGLRIDDGSDNNYASAYLWPGANYFCDLVVKYRSGGGGVTTTTISTGCCALGDFVTICLLRYLVGGGNWTHFTYWRMETGNNVGVIPTSSTVTWSVSRVGVIFGVGVGGGGSGFVDWLTSEF